MLPAQRQARIVQRLQEDGFVEITELSLSLRADRSTIRRDLRELELQGLVRRTRGGALAGPASGEKDIPYEVKRIENMAPKQAIGAYAATLISEGEAVLLDSGSTTFQIARALRKRNSISVVTNDLNVAMCLADSPGIQLVVTGGILLESVYTLVGPQTVAELSGLNVDRAFLGADAIHHEAGITNVTFVEVEVKRAMIAAALEVVVVADASKFEHRALAPVVGLDGVDMIITDDGLDPSVRALYGDVVHCVAADGVAEGFTDDPKRWARRPRSVSAAHSD
jgi:DeoR family transcriptional regulator, aga operon transcriptional repressor